MPADGGPYAYARIAFGNRHRFRQRLVVLDHRVGRQRRDRGRLGALRRGLHQQGPHEARTVLLVLVGLWVPAAINLSGVKNMGSVQVFTSILKFAALAFMSIVGLFYIKSDNYTPFNASGDSAIARSAAAWRSPCSATWASRPPPSPPAKVRDPDRNVARATILGTVATAVVYMLSLVAVFGILPTAELANSTRAVLDAINVMFGGEVWGNVDGGHRDRVRHRRAQRLDHDLRRDAARRGQGRPVPRALQAPSTRRVPAFGIIVSTALASVAIVDQLPGRRRPDGLHDAGPHDRHHGRDPLRVLRAGADQVAARRPPHACRRPRFVRDVVVAVMSLVFSVLFIWYSRFTGESFWIYWAPFILAGRRAAGASRSTGACAAV